MNTRKLNIKLLDSAVRVDVVAMPKMTIKELKLVNLNDVSTPEKGHEAEATPAPEPTIKPDDIVMKKEVPKKDFKSFLKELGQKVPEKSKAKTPGKGNAKDAKLDNEMRSDLKNLVVAGNKLSEGRALVGTGAQKNSGEFEKYLWGLPDHVRPFWLLPSYLTNSALQCRIRIFLSRNGDLIKSIIFETSGNAEYDERAMAAVQKASPYPVPPPEFIPRVLDGEIILGFPL